MPLGLFPRSFNRSLCASLARISNDLWWTWHLFYRCCPTDWRLGKGTVSVSFLPFTLSWKYMRNNVHFHSIPDTGLWIIPSLWPIVSHLNPKLLCEMASPHKWGMRNGWFAQRWTAVGLVPWNPKCSRQEWITDIIDSNLCTIFLEADIHTLLEYLKW